MLEFRVPVMALGVNASSTRVQQTQHLRMRNEREVHLETESVSLDVPYGDSFLVHTMWRLTPADAPAASTSGAGCLLQVCTTLRWIKSVWMIKSMFHSI